MMLEGWKPLQVMCLTCGHVGTAVMVMSATAFPPGVKARLTCGHDSSATAALFTWRVTVSSGGKVGSLAVVCPVCSRVVPPTSTQLHLDQKQAAAQLACGHRVRVRAPGPSWLPEIKEE